MTTFASTFFDACFFGGRAAIGDVQLHMVVDLADPFTVEELRAAATATVEAFPILGCRYRPGWWRDRWEAAPDLPSPVEERSVEEAVEEVTTELVRRPLDPREVGPWRVVQIRAGDGCRLLISVAHMLADANGALVVVHELARHLSGGPSRQAWPDRPMERGMGQLLRAIRLRDLGQLLLQSASEALLPVRYLGMARPVDHWHPNADRDGRELYRTVTVDVGRGTPMRERCRSLGCTLNDALVSTLALLNRSLSAKGNLGNIFTVNLRKLLRDERPRIANLSGMEMVVLPRALVTDLEGTAVEVSRRIGRKKRRFAGLPPLIANFSTAWAMPHALLRPIIGLWLRYAMAVLNRGLTVTNIGAMDPYVEPLGDRATGASMIGPFLNMLGPPLITAAGFRDRLTLQVAGFDGRYQHQLDQVTDALVARMEEWATSRRCDPPDSW